jgi:hypothetical protein
MSIKVNRLEEGHNSYPLVCRLPAEKKIQEAKAFNFTYRYIDDVLSINNSRFAEFLPLIYPPELEIKETTDTAGTWLHIFENL